MMFKTILLVYSKDGKLIHSSKSKRASLRAAKSDANNFWKDIRPDVPKSIEILNGEKREYYLDNFEKLSFVPQDDKKLKK